jgi:hypothetical protein
MSAWVSPSVFGDVVGLSVGVGRIIAFRDIRSFEIDLLLVLNHVGQPHMDVASANLQSFVSRLWRLVFEQRAVVLLRSCAFSLLSSVPIELDPTMIN